MRVRGQAVVSVSDLMQKYRALRAPQGTVVDVFARIASERVGRTIDASKISYNPHTRTVYVAVSGPLKNELRLQNTQILRTCAQVLGAENAPLSCV